jgi:hypothetical protein
MIGPILTGAEASSAPFPHVRIPAILLEEHATEALRWLHEKAPWRLRVEHFYVQEEFSLLSSKLTDGIRYLVESSFVEPISDTIRQFFKLPAKPILVDINAHRLTPGQTIRIHNDFIEREETHRLLIQLNEGWTAEQGGLLMLFSSPRPEDVHSVILPKNRSALAFEISHRSFHAVSTIKHGERYTVVYSFRAST